MTRTRREPKDEAGYVLVWAVISLTALLLMGALAIDVGAFYVRSGQIERAADAASLAGVVHMPGDLTAATASAHQILRKNGFDPDDPDIDVVVEEGSTPRRLRVSVTDMRVETYLARFIRDSIAITRVSEAEFSQPLLMGSPDNYLGSGDLHPYYPNTKPPDYAEEQGFWLAVNGFCTAAEDGDLRAAGYDGTRRTSPYAYHCDDINGTPNANYGDGWDYVVQVPNGRSGNVEVDLFDPNYWPDDRPCESTQSPGNSCNFYNYVFQSWYAPNYRNWKSSSSENRFYARPIDQRGDGTKVGEITTYFQLFYPDSNNTPLDYSDDTPVSAPLAFSGGSAAPYTWPYDATYLSDFGALQSQFNRWVNTWTITTGMPSGDYRVRVWTEGGQPNSFGVNAFSIRAGYSGTGGQRCDSRVVGQETCPQVSGAQGLSILGAVEGSSASFKLAQIPLDYAGKTIQVQLWDPGEGGQELSFRNPDRALDQKWPFAWREAPGPFAVYDTWQGAYDIDVSGCGPAWPQPGAPGTRFGDCKFNDRMVEVNIDVPADYAASDAGWWAINYEYGSGISVTDRTAWLVDVVGDPVHLVEPG